MFEKIKKFFKKTITREYENSSICLNEQENKKNNFEYSQVEIEPIIKQIKRSLKYRK
jgi:hypothetical protein